MLFVSAAAAGNSYFDENRTAAAVGELKALSIMEGDPDGGFRESDTLSRAEMAAVICRMGAYADEKTESSDFNDISGCFAEHGIIALSSRGILNGYEDGKFCPENPVTYGEFIAALVRFYWYENTGSAGILDYPRGYMNEAERLTLISSANVFDPNAYITRGDAAVLAKNALSEELNSGKNLKNIIIERMSSAENSKTTPAPSAGNVPTFAPNGDNAFAYKLNAELKSDNNYMFSPFSIKTALAMAANAAEDYTQSEILDAIGVEDLSEFNSRTKTLLERYAGGFDYDEYERLANKLMTGNADDEESDKYWELERQLRNGVGNELSIANSIWVNDGYYPGQNVRFKSDFEDIIREYYGGTSEVVSSGDAVQRINEWTSEKTHGKINSITGNSDFLAALVNAVYFKGAWENEFSEYATEKGVFHNADGKDSETDFMHDTGYYRVYIAENVSMIELPYRGGSTAMYISLDNGEYINHDQRFEKLESAYVRLALPKFKIEYSVELNDALESLGIKSAFSPAGARFGNMLNNVPGTDNVYIQNAVHKTYISVDEKGTEAAAVTGMMAGGSALPPEPIEFIADRPFTFMIRDTKTGEILFMGRYSEAE